MKGLLLKELFMLRKAWFAVAIFIVTFSLIGIFGGQPQMLLLVSLFMSVWQVNFMNMDEISRWQQYSLALPYGRRKIVSSKYLMVLILDVFSIVFVILCYLISVALGKVVFSADLLLMLIFLSLIMGIAYPTVILPLNYKLNAQKGKMLLMIMNGVVGGASVTIMQLSVNIFSYFAEYIPFIILATVILLYLLSWKLSIKIYEKKDL